MISVDGTRLELLADAGSTCYAFARVELVETTTAITIRAFVERVEPIWQGCGLVFKTEEIVVELDGPLDDRELKGCLLEKGHQLEGAIEASRRTCSDLVGL